MKKISGKLYPYGEFLEETSTVVSELKMWKQFLRRKGVQPKNSIEALDHCNENFPNIQKLLQILSVLPVSKSTPERTNSCLKRIKTYLRNTTKEVIRNLLFTSMSMDILASYKISTSR